MTDFHTYLANVIPENAKYDDTLGERFTNPGAGAFSYHTGHDFHSTTHISAGDEIFCDYGENWLDRRSGTFADSVPRYDDFEIAAKAFLEIVKNIRESHLELTDGVLNLLKNVSTMFNQRAASVFPVTKDLFHEIMTIILQRSEDSDDENIGDIAKLLAKKITIVNRDIPWILENGICMEKIRPGISTIPGAGRGAFAQEFIPKGTMVSPVPLLNIIDRDLLNMYRYDDDDDDEKEEEEEEGKGPVSELIGKQLLLNYCFGHRDSKLLLCPQSNMILMNHQSPVMASKDKDNNDDDKIEIGPNARIQWADGWDPSTAEWLKMPYQEVVAMTENGRRGLSFEVVAMRDILPGEEVTIDYGENWQKAWDEHVATWEADPPIDDGSYIPVRTIMDEEDYRTLEEQQDHPYPANVLTVCYYPEGFDNYPDEGYEEEHWDGSEVIPPYGMDVAYDLYPCDIVERNTNVNVEEGTGTDATSSTSFTVDIFPAYDSDNSKVVRLLDYPKDSVSFRMWPYKSDVHLPNAFRHYMEIPDDIFPDEWKIGYD